MKRYILVLFLLLSFSGYSQNTINNYKYVIVPEKYAFLKQNDQYSLNSLTKYLLQDKGFTVYLDNAELPTEIANNKCNALSADLLEKGGMFVTSITLVLKDCHGNIVFKSKEGKSREKEYNVAYNMALRDAFSSLDQTPYTYNGSTNEAESAATLPAVATTATTAATAASPEPVKQVTSSTASAAPVKSEVASPTMPATKTVKATVSTTDQLAGTLYAQAIANGYQLIDTTPKIVLTLLKTSAENYYIASNATSNGIVLKKNQDWFFEYYKDGMLVSEKLQVKF